jgi:hypothetical protein
VESGEPDFRGPDFRGQTRKQAENYFFAFLVVLPAAFLGEAFFAGAFLAFLAAITIYS